MSLVDVTKPRVLLVEDDRAVRSALMGSLESAGFDVIGVEEAGPALDVLARRRIDVVITDYHLPGIAGLDLLAAIRGTAPGTILILYSGGMTEELAAEARDYGVAVVLEKPISAELLIAAVRRAQETSDRGSASPEPRP